MGNWLQLYLWLFVAVVFVVVVAVVVADVVFGAAVVEYRLVQ